MMAPERGDGSARLLAIATVVLVLAAARAARPVLVPLVFALFFTALLWPLQRRLQRRLPRGLSAVITTLVFLGFAAALGGAAVAAVDTFAERGAPHVARMERIARDALAWLAGRGLHLDDAGFGGLHARTVDLARGAVEVFTGTVLVVAFLLLCLLEVTSFREKLRRIKGERGEGWFGAIDRLAADLRRYAVVRTLVGLISGAGTALVCVLVGVDFAAIWGVLAFLLNYVPTVGSIVAVAPPLLLAAAQFDDPIRVVLTLAGLAGMQLLTGNTIDPLVQGRYLRLSPLVVLLSVVFWGWFWGLPGAFLSVPITVAVAVATRRDERTRWIATLLAGSHNG